MAVESLMLTHGFKPAPNRYFLEPQFPHLYNDGLWEVV
jgi:hypothetical protein